MSKLSILIPSYNEPYLRKTLRDILNKTKGTIEIFVNIDGDMPKKLIKDKRIRYFHHQVPIGMRGGINLGLKKAKGKYIMKTDAHCLFASGFDEVLKRDCRQNWLMIPRRYSLDEEKWGRNLNMPIKDYHYLSFPLKTSYGTGTFPVEWKEKTYERINKPEFMIDDIMTMQGSCWFAHRKYFMKQVGYLNDSPDSYSTFSDEPLEVGLKYWLGGGEMKVNKNTWYAHLNKRPHHYNNGLFSREYKISRITVKAHTWAAKHWINNQEPKMKHSFQWLIEKFWPVPGWPEDKKLWKFPK